MVSFQKDLIRMTNAEKGPFAAQKDRKRASSSVSSHLDLSDTNSVSQRYAQEKITCFDVHIVFHDTIGYNVPFGAARLLADVTRNTSNSMLVAARSSARL